MKAKMKTCTPPKKYSEGQINVILLPQSHTKHWNASKAKLYFSPIQYNKTTKFFNIGYKYHQSFHEVPSL